MYQNETTLESESMGLTLRRDDFSLQVTHPDNPRLWIRIENGIVTDFIPAGLTERKAALALLFAATRAGVWPAEALVFADIAPSSQKDLADREAELRRILAAVAAIEKIFVREISLDRRGEKVDLRASFDS